MADAKTIVQHFCDAWAKGNLDDLMAFFADDAVYHNIPVAPVTGKAAIRATIEGFTTGVEAVVFETHRIAVDGNAVFTERDDIFTFTNGTRVSLPVAGVFEVDADGKISAWRDYFDLNMFTSQLPSPGA
jgi:limonene-1,2-epoxide hydrolase